MFRSSIAAFYRWLVCVFYNSAGSVRRDTFFRFRLLLRIRSEVEKIIHGMPKILFTAKIVFRGLDRCMSEQELNLLKLTATVVAQLAQVRRRSCGAMCPKPTLWQQLLTTYQTTFCEMPRPHTFPFLATARKILPSVTCAARVQLSRAILTQLGMGTVRMWPRLPTSSDLRNPQPNSMASIA